MNSNTHSNPEPKNDSLNMDATNRTRPSADTRLPKSLGGGEATSFALDGISDGHWAAFVKTVGEEASKESKAQTQLVGWLNGQVDKLGTTIRPRIYNKNWVGNWL